MDEPVDGDDAGQPEVVAHVVDVPFEVGNPLFERLEVLVVQRALVAAAVILERAHRRDDDGGGRAKTRFTALDVDELLGAQVGSEPCLGHDVIGQLERRSRGDDRVAAVGDVSERPSMDERDVLLQRLNEVRLDRVPEQDRHGALSVQIADVHRRAVARVADENVAESRFQVGDGGGQAQNGHDL